MAVVKKMRMNVTEEQLALLVEEPFFSKGKDCFQEGYVGLMEVSEDHVEAHTVGKRLYSQSLYFSEDGLDGECSCPAYNLYGPCKHMAAVGFALMADSEGEYEPGEVYIQRVEFLVHLEQILKQKEKEELVELLIDIINHDPEKALLLEEQGFLAMAADDFWM